LLQLHGGLLTRRTEESPASGTELSSENWKGLFNTKPDIGVRFAYWFLKEKRFD